MRRHLSRQKRTLRLRSAVGLRHRVKLALCVLFFLIIPLLSAGLLFSIPQPGVIGAYYDNPDWSGTPAIKQHEQDIDLTTYEHARAQRQLPSTNFSITWNGWVRIDEDGDYRMMTVSDDGSSVFLDDRLILDNGGYHGAKRAESEIFLTKGMHKIAVNYFNGAGSYAFSFQIARDGQKTVDKVISSANFFPRPLSKVMQLFTRHAWLRGLLSVGIFLSICLGLITWKYDRLRYILNNIKERYLIVHLAGGHERMMFKRINQENISICFLLVVLYIIFFFPYLNTGYTTQDDTELSLVAQHGFDACITYIFDQMKTQGRMVYFVSLWATFLPFSLMSFTVVQLFNILTIVTNIMLFAVIIARFVKKNTLCFLIPLLFLMCVQDNWQHNILTTYPIRIQVGLLGLLLSLYCLLRFLESLKKIYLVGSLTAYFLCIFFAEWWVLYVVFHLIILHIYPGMQRKKIHLFALSGLFIGVNVFFTGLYYAVRLFFPSQYGGNQLSSFNLQAAMRVIYQYSISAFPLYTFSVNKDFLNTHSPFFTSYTERSFGKNVLYLVQNMTDIPVSWIVYVLLFAYLVLCLLHRKDVSLSLKAFGGLCCTGGIAIFLPNILVGFTPKYQDWVVIHGSFAYVPTYFSYFGVVLVLVSCSLFMLGKIRTRHSIYYPSLLIVSAAFSLVAGMHLYVNSAYLQDKILSHKKWQLFDLFLDSPEFTALPDNTLVYAPSLFAPRGIVALSDYYWSSYIVARTGKHIAITRTLPSNNSQPFYYLKYAQETSRPNQFIVFAKVKTLVSDPNPDILEFFGDDVHVYVLTTQRDYTLSFYRQDANAKVFIDQTEVFFPGSHVVNHVLRQIVPEALQLTEISSETGIHLNTVTLSFFANHPFPENMILSWEGGFSAIEGTSENNWRWCSSEGTLQLINRSQTPLVMMLEMNVMTGYEEFSNLTIESALFAEPEHLKVNFQGTAFTKTVKIPPGKHIVTFASDARRVYAPADPRFLVFRINNFSFCVCE